MGTQAWALFPKLPIRLTTEAELSSQNSAVSTQTAALVAICWVISLKVRSDNGVHIWWKNHNGQRIHDTPVKWWCYCFLLNSITSPWHAPGRWVFWDKAHSLTSSTSPSRMRSCTAYQSSQTLRWAIWKNMYLLLLQVLTSVLWTGYEPNKNVTS